MLYDSDINGLLSDWEARLSYQTPDYKAALGECIYDLKSLMEKRFNEEALANEAFEQQLDENYLEVLEAHDKLCYA